MFKLSCVLTQGSDIVPIPGTRSRSRLEENAAAARVSLTEAEFEEIDAVIPRDMAVGARYPEQAMTMLNG